MNAPRLALPAFFVALAAVSAWLVARQALMVDDAFISFRSAENWVQHGALTFNPGERSEGFSNPLWTLLIAGALALHLAPTTAVVALAALCAGLCLLLTFRATRQLDVSPSSAALATVVLATNLSFVTWVGGGLETLSVALLVLAGLTTRRRSVAVLCAVLLVFSRPEGIAFALAVSVASLRRREHAHALVATAIAAVALFAVRHGYYGEWLAIPSYAKGGFTLDQLQRGAVYVWRFFVDDGALFVLPLVILGALTRRDAWPLTLTVLGGLGFALLVGGDGLYRSRFAVHVLPLLCVLVALGLQQARARSVRWHRLALGFVALAVVLPLLQPPMATGLPLEQQRFWEGHWSAVGRGLRAHLDEVLPQRTWSERPLLATNVAGRLPYESRLATIDLLGLTDLTIARTPVERLGSGYAGHERAAPQYVLEKAPELLFISVLDGLDEELLVDPRQVSEALSRTPLWRYRALTDTPAFVASYRPAILTLDDGTTGTFFVRRETALATATARLRVLEWATP